MKFSMECEVEASSLLSDTVSINHDGIEYTFYPNEEGKLGKIQLTMPVEDPEKFYSEIKSNPSGRVKHSIRMDLDAEIHQRLTLEFQRLEAVLTHNGVRCIVWDQPKLSWIPETEEEKAKTKVFSLEQKKEYPQIEEKLDNELLEREIGSLNKYDELIVLHAFLREGKNEFRKFRYINAFYNFYFVLEDLYGGNNTKNDLIEKNFLESKELMVACKGP
ncbi:MAG: hypothetical protein ACLFUZ_02250 [Candidatus Micrarchaeia archaeon]